MKKVPRFRYVGPVAGLMPALRAAIAELGRQNHHRYQFTANN